MTKINSPKKKLSTAQVDDLLKVLKARFEKNMKRHKGLAWDKVQERLEGHPAKLWSLFAMEETGGEPDVIGHDKKTGEYIFMIVRQRVRKAAEVFVMIMKHWKKGKENKPDDSALNLADEMGIELLAEEEYRELQKLGEYDLKTSNWVQTPAAIRKLGGAVFCDRRYDTVFLYHNGAESYYAARGFRGSLRV